jgi:hypothetical protein
VSSGAPVIAFTKTPTDPDTATSPTFTWSFDDGANGSGLGSYRCRLDADVWESCSTPDELTGLAAGSHTFQVVATDKAGNSSNQLSYTWMIEAEPGTRFTITGSAIRSLYPGAAPSIIGVTIHNPNDVPIYVTSLTVAVSNRSCDPAKNIALQQVDLSTATTPGQLQVPADGTVTLPAQGLAAPTIRMIDTDVDQAPACAHQTFQLSFDGSAHS